MKILLGKLGFLFKGLMKKRLLGRKNLNIIAATSMTIFTLLAVFTGVYAWFVAKLNDSKSGELFDVAMLDSTIEEISIHSFYGTTTEEQERNRYYGFNPVPVGYINYANHLNPTTIGDLSIQLENYLLEDPHHPVLLLFKVNGNKQSIVGKTDYPFLSKNIVGPTNLPSSYVVANYEALLAKQGSASDGDIFEVTNDNSQNGKYDSSTKVKARYQYHASDSSFERVWVDLGTLDNPLSSIIQIHSFKYSFTNPFNVDGQTITVNPSSTALETKTYRHAVGDEQTQSASGIWIPVSGFKGPNDENTNMSSFVSIDEGGDATFKREAVFYNGSVSDYTYIGIVVDYYPDALVYFSSYYMGHHFLYDDVTFKCDWIMVVQYE